MVTKDQRHRDNRRRQWIGRLEQQLLKADDKTLVAVAKLLGAPPSERDELSRYLNP